jgi:Protein of unknown function (DUF2568)
MDAIKAANLALRFALELCALGALGYWGAKTGYRSFAKIGLAIAAPLVAAVAWVLFVAPNATLDAGPVVRLVVELLVFGAAAAGLVSLGRTGLGVGLAVVYALNRLLMAVWDQ